MKNEIINSALNKNANNDNETNAPPNTSIGLSSLPPRAPAGPETEQRKFGPGILRLPLHPSVSALSSANAEPGAPGFPLTPAVGEGSAGPVKPDYDAQEEHEEQRLLHSSVSALNARLRPENRHARIGKIARLPYDVREQVNAMIRSGFRYLDIVARLTEQGYPNITANNVSFWKSGGYLDWLDHQHERETRLGFTKALEHCTRATSIDHVQQTAIIFAADQLARIMQSFDYGRALDLLSERPELFPSFVAAMKTLTGCTTDLAKAFDLTQKREAIVRQDRTEHFRVEASNPAPTLNQPSNPKINGNERESALDGDHGFNGRIKPALEEHQVIPSNPK